MGFRKPSISTSPVRASCTIPATRPSILSKSIVGVVLLMLFLVLISSVFGLECVSEREKARWLESPAGLDVSLDLSGRLVQAMAVRRHGGSMMGMMTVM